jgi:hypothetical protein
MKNTRKGVLAIGATAFFSLRALAELSLANSPKPEDFVLFTGRKAEAPPRVGNLITFRISGPGVIAAVDNADNASHELFRTNQRHAFQGWCVAFIKASAPPGKIILTASAPSLKTGSTTIETTQPLPSQ